MSRLTLLVALCGALVLGASRAAAQEDEARIQFEQGTALYDEGQFEQAAVAFQRAFELKPSYKILFNIAQAQNQLGHYAAALEAYARYLAEGGDAVSAERQREVKAEIERLNSLVGVLVVESAVDGAAVFVDGRRKGETPLPGPLIVDLGERELVVKSGGEEIHHELVTVAGSQRVVVTVEAPEPEEEEVEPGPVVLATESQDSGRVWTWVLLGAGAAVAIAGGVIGGVSMSREKALLDECEDQHCPPSKRDEGDAIQRLNLTADVLYGVGAACLVTGVILFFVEPDDDEEPALSATPAAARSGLGLTVRGRF